MLIENLYNQGVTEREAYRISTKLKIDATHPLYLGHFPGFPVTPGVCQLLMIREILENELKMKLILVSAKQIKFTAVHDPGTDPEIDGLISYVNKKNGLMVTASLRTDTKVFIKFKGEFRKRK